MTIGILVPIAIFFGLCVWMATAMSSVAVKNIENRHQPD